MRTLFIYILNYIQRKKLFHLNDGKDKNYIIYNKFYCIEGQGSNMTVVSEKMDEIEVGRTKNCCEQKQ